MCKVNRGVQFPCDDFMRCKFRPIVRGYCTLSTLVTIVLTISRVQKFRLRCWIIVWYLSHQVRLPGTVKPSNIRHTHFSRNPKIAQFLKAYDFVKEFGEGVDRVCRELEANGTPHLSFHLDDFILKITVPKVTEKVIEKRWLSMKN